MAGIWGKQLAISSKGEEDSIDKKPLAQNHFMLPGGS